MMTQNERLNILKARACLTCGRPVALRELGTRKARRLPLYCTPECQRERPTRVAERRLASKNRRDERRARGLCQLCGLTAATSRCAACKELRRLKRGRDSAKLAGFVGIALPRDNRTAAQVRREEQQRVYREAAERARATVLDSAADVLQVTQEDRSRRARDVRPVTLSVRSISKRQLAISALAYPETDHWRPRTRAECIDGVRPCPFVACKWNLYLDVNENNGSVQLNFPDLEPHEMGESCALDVASRGGARLEDVGAMMNIVRERVRQIEIAAKQEISSRLRRLAGDADSQPRVRLRVLGGVRGRG